MGRPSVIEASADKRGGRTLRVRVAGSTVIAGEGSMTIAPGY
jgi:predicted PhzF superfamily epimerase YddE/YHI9